jgi:hypothetical protein
LPFRDLLNEEVILVKRNGQRFELKARVDTHTVFSGDPSIPIEVGDFFERMLPSNVVETYEVTEPGFRREMGGHYQTKVKRIQR